MGVARRLKGAWWSNSKSVRLEASGTGGATMPRYAQLVMGPAGSGKVRIWRAKEGNVGVCGRWGGSGPEGRPGGCMGDAETWAAWFFSLTFTVLFVVLLKGN